jgi:hypothetical protein
VVTHQAGDVRRPVRVRSRNPAACLDTGYEEERDAEHGTSDGNYDQCGTTVAADPCANSHEPLRIMRRRGQLARICRRAARLHR